MKILITGAGGKLGSEMIQTFSGDYELVLIYHTTPKQQPPNATCYEVDFADPTGLPEIVATEKPDVIIHLAALLGGACQKDPVLTWAVNVDATRRLAELAATNQVGRFLFASTAAVYDLAERRQVSEDDAESTPQSAYGLSKMQAEQALQKVASNKQNTTEFVSLRIFNMYGPLFTDSLVYKMAHSTAEAPLTLFGPHNFVRDYIHSNDVIEAFVRAATMPLGKPYVNLNIASGVGIDNEGLAQAMIDQGLTPHFTIIPGSPSYSWANIQAAERLLGFNPNTTISADL